MSRQTLGVCIVGCGDLGTKHAERWNNLTQARVVAVVDIIEKRAKILAQACQLDSWYTDFELAVSLPDVDVVSVCTPTHLHPDITIFAANQGKHILCEKPIALTLEAADAMIAAAQRNNVKLGIGFMRRYSPIMANLQEALSKGTLGRPVMAHAKDIREVRPKREMHDIAANGGPIIDMGVHVFDGWATIFNARPVEVFARGLTIANDRPELAHIPVKALDTATIVVRYASGDVGAFVVSWGLPPGLTPPGGPDQIIGPEGMMRVSFGITHQSVELLQANGDSELVFSADLDMYQLEIDDFARAVLHNQPPKTGGADGKAALQVALAAIESIRTGSVVKLD